MVRIESLFKIVVYGFAEVWPSSRTSLEGVSLGDVWPCDTLLEPNAAEDSTDHYVVFHKLSQWMTYSIMEPLETMLNIEWDNATLLTGLPEYRNGNHIVDTFLYCAIRTLLNRDSGNLTISLNISTDYRWIAG